VKTAIKLFQKVTVSTNIPIKTIYASATTIEKTAVFDSLLSAKSVPLIGNKNFYYETYHSSS